jgi:inner membrane protein
MDNVTHGLWGLGIYGAWLATAPQPLPHGLAAAVCTAAMIGSEAPDFDYVVRLTKGPVAYLRQHRAISHSIPMWFMWALVISGVISVFEPGHFGLLFSVSLIGVLIHVGLDLLTSYGTQAFWPASQRRIGLDALFIIDPVMLVAGFVGWILAGTGWWTVGHAVFVMLCIVCIYIALRCLWAGFLYDRVRKQYPSEWKVSVLPGPVPLWWTFVAQTPTELMAGKVSARGDIERDIHWRWPHRDEATLHRALNETTIGRVFHWFARHLIWTIRETESEVRVILADAMYRYGRNFPFTAVITFSKTDSAHVGQFQKLTVADTGALFEQASFPTKARENESFT